MHTGVLFVSACGFYCKGQLQTLGNKNIVVDQLRQMEDNKITQKITQMEDNNTGSSSHSCLYHLMCLSNVMNLHQLGSLYILLRCVTSI